MPCKSLGLWLLPTLLYSISSVSRLRTIPCSLREGLLKGSCCPLPSPKVQYHLRDDVHRAGHLVYNMRVNCLPLKIPDPLRPKRHKQIISHSVSSLQKTIKGSSIVRTKPMLRLIRDDYTNQQEPSQGHWATAYQEERSREKHKYFGLACQSKHQR